MRPPMTPPSITRSAPLMKDDWSLARNTAACAISSGMPARGIGCADLNRPSSTSALLWLAGATLVLRYLEAVILILPPLHVSGFALLLDLPAAMLVVGASWLMAWRVAKSLWNRWSRRPAAAG